MYVLCLDHWKDNVTRRENFRSKTNYVFSDIDN